MYSFLITDNTDLTFYLENNFLISWKFFSQLAIFSLDKAVIKIHGLSKGTIICWAMQSFSRSGHDHRETAMFE